MSLQTGARRDAPATPPPRRLTLGDPQHAHAAAVALAGGAVIAHGFANFYVITTRPDRETVRSVNLMKGRPADQVGSLTTAPLCIPLAFDWSRLPAGLTRVRVISLLDALLALGPCGFRGPAAPRVPDHLSQMDGEVRTAQVIVPGYACPSNDFLGQALVACGQDMLYITSANRSRHVCGSEEEPAHHRADGLRADFGGDPRFVLLEHADEEAARRAYSMHAPMSTTIIAFHRTLGPDAEGRRRLVVERHGSLHIDDLRRVVRRRAGVQVVDSISLGIVDNREVGRLDPRRLVTLAGQLDLRRAEAIVLSACVQMPSLAAISAVEDRTRLPVLSAATATAHQLLLAVGSRPRIPHAGWLLSGAS